MKTVFLDLATLRAQDLDLTHLRSSCGELITHELTGDSERAARIGGAEILISNKVCLSAKEMAAAPALKLICVAATGTNNVDLAAARARGISVCNAQGYSAESVAQHTLTMLLMLMTRLHQYHDEIGEWSRSPMFCRLDHPISELAGKTLGIVGYGNIGQRVAELAKAFRMQVLVAQLPGRNSDGERIALDELLPLCDAVSLHCPLSEATSNLFDARRLSLMRKDALLINVARGGIVNETDLLAALKNETIAGAALDVLGEEPPNRDHPLLNAQLPNLLLTPHIAWASREARQTLVDQVAENIQAFRSGRSLRVVN